MKTSKQWWDETKADTEKFNKWLQKQYIGELTAADRIERYCTSKSPAHWKPILKRIADDEMKHAGWVLELLTARGVVPITDHTDRYWEETLSKITSFESATAVAAHAENMRLERIQVIAEDTSVPVDVKSTFEKILKDELFHASAFEKMAGDKAMADALEAHINGTEAIGLINTNEVL